MLTTGVFKLIEVKRTGLTGDKRKYVHVLAVDFFNQTEKDSKVKPAFFILKAFGSSAEFIERNMAGARRAFVSGDLVVDTYTDKMEVSKKLTFNGATGNAKFKIDVEKTALSINISTIRFLDKPNETATTFVADDVAGEEVEFVVDDADENIVDGNATETSGSSNYVLNVDEKKSEESDELPPRGNKGKGKK